MLLGGGLGGARISRRVNSGDDHRPSVRTPGQTPKSRHSRRFSTLWFGG
jgi:hypothetical protein